jgi:hypothetical protein
MRLLGRASLYAGLMRELARTALDNQGAEAPAANGNNAPEHACLGRALIRPLLRAAAK